jgi:hypothetical protein
MPLRAAETGTISFAAVQSMGNDLPGVCQSRECLPVKQPAAGEVPGSLPFVDTGGRNNAPVVFGFEFFVIGHEDKHTAEDLPRFEVNMHQFVFSFI